MHRWLSSTAACLFFLTTFNSTGGEPIPSLRRPVGLALSVDEATLFVANQRSGTLSVVDTRAARVIEEVSVARRLSDLAVTADHRQLLLTDDAQHELIWLEVTADNPTSRANVRQRLSVSPFPVGVAVTRDGRRCFVTSLWSRRLSVVDLPNEPGQLARVTHVIDLPLAPRRLILVQHDERLIVADSFAGQLFVLDTSTPAAAPRPLGLREFPGHNIRGLGVNHDGSMLVVAHQMLNEVAHTIRNDVHWGLLMSNDLRWLRLDRVLAGGGDLFSGGHMHPLGQAGSATADPAGLAVAPDGTVVVTLGGVAEIASGKEADFSLERAAVGSRPTAVVTTRDSRWAYVANTFADSVSRVDLVERESKVEMSLGPQPELSLVDRGELLFYDGRLSHDGWMSCQSCHSDGHTNGQLNDNFSDKSFGAPKRVLTLLGRADTAPFAWNGSAATLPEQIRKSLINTMQSNQDPSERVVTALTAYIESLASPPSLDVLRGTRDDAAVRRGTQLFADLKCIRCHAPPTYTSPQTYNVGLQDQQGNDHFNPPSLRGVGQRAPYFHDNRATTLEDVFRSYGHQLDGELNDTQLADLLAFLRSL